MLKSFSFQFDNQILEEQMSEYIHEVENNFNLLFKDTSKVNQSIAIDYLKRESILLESDVAPLKTPDFIGTDTEKIDVLNYWSDLVGLIRSIKVCVISQINKIAIINQLKAEIELLDNEINNNSSAVIKDENGMVSLRKEPEIKPEIKAYQQVIDLTKSINESKKLSINDFKRLAGI